METRRLLSISLGLTFLLGFGLASSPTEGFEESLKGFIGQWDKDHGPTRVGGGGENDLPSSSEDSISTVSVSTTDDEESASSDNASSSNCTRCVPHEDARASRLESIKAQILDKLRLSRPPNISRTAMMSIPPVREYLNALNENGDDAFMQSDSPFDDRLRPTTTFDDRGSVEVDDDEYHLNTEKVISLAQNPSENLRIDPEMSSVFFNFAQNLFTYHVSKAHLWISVRDRVIFSEDRPAQLFIYQVVRHTSRQNVTLRKFKEMKVEPSMVKDGWLTVEVKKLVSQWFHRPKGNLGVVIHLNDAEGRLFKVFDPDNQEQPAPFLEVQLQTSKRGRKKRSLDLKCRENSKEVRCCRYPLTVDFEEFGWDWVIAPKRYEANYCSGECPYVFLQTYPHTHLTTLVSPQGSTGPCCSSKKLSSISMLFYNPEQGNIVLGMLPNMVVESCGCN